MSCSDVRPPLDSTCEHAYVQRIDIQSAECTGAQVYPNVTNHHWSEESSEPDRRASTAPSSPGLIAAPGWRLLIENADGV